MPVSPDLILFAIRSAIRLGRAASLELEAAIRNRDIAMPGVITVTAEPNAGVKTAIEQATLTDKQREQFTNLFKRWQDGDRSAEAEIWAQSRELAITAVIEDAQEKRGFIVINQWAEGAKKQIPLARIGLALVEVALDYAGTNPGIFGVGSNGERFIRAIAGAIDEILPNSDAPGIITAESLFTERSIAILLHAGLSALEEHIADNIGEEHLRDITIAVLKPVTDSFKDGKIERRTIHDFRDLLLGPMTQEALKAVARNQAAFLGSRFGTNDALGAVTKALLTTLASDHQAGGGATWDISRNLVDREVWMKIYVATLDVAIQRPELFGGESDKDGSKFGRDLIKTTAENLKKMTPPFTASVAAIVAADAISVLSRHTVILYGASDKPWDVVARNATGSVLNSVSAGIKAGLVAEAGAAGAIIIKKEEIFGRVFSEEQLGALLRVVLDQAAKTPEMIVGRDQRDEVKALVAGIARSVSTTNRNLLSAEDWLEVAAILAEEAARNPGQLFKIVDANGHEVDPGEEFAVKLITQLLQAAAADFRARGRANGAVLFGVTLKEVIIETLRVAADNAAQAVTNEAALLRLVERINALQVATPGGFGRNAWLRVFRNYLKTALFTGNALAAINAIPDADLRKLLAA
jgi:hypothetical protein